MTTPTAAAARRWIGMCLVACVWAILHGAGALAADAARERAD